MIPYITLIAASASAILYLHDGQDPSAFVAAMFAIAAIIGSKP